MPDKPTDGYIINFDNSFGETPKSFDFIRIWQIGEFSIEHDREIGAHMQGCHEITYVISGKGTFFAGDEHADLEQGDVQVICKGTEHRIVPDKRSNLRFANIGFGFADQVPEQFRAVQELFEKGGAFCLKDKGEIRLLMTQLINELYAKAALSQEMAECCIKQVLIHTYRLAMAEEPKIFTPKKSASKLSTYAIIRYVDDNFYDFPGIEEIAQALGYSQSYISHIFKEKMGMTLQDYICKKKIEASLDFLKYQKYTITQIAMMLNYASVQSFGKAFRKVMGCSPTEYQKRHGLQMSNEDGDTGK